LATATHLYTKISAIAASLDIDRRPLYTVTGDTATEGKERLALSEYNTDTDFFAILGAYSLHI